MARWDMESQNPMELFQSECPALSAAFDSVVQAQRANDSLDSVTKQLINLACQTSTRNPRGVYFHAMMARKQGATRDQVVAAVTMPLHLCGLAPVLDCLPQAIAGWDAGA